jgi:hypothetical protein
LRHLDRPARLALGELQTWTDELVIVLEDEGEFEIAGKLTIRAFSQIQSPLLYALAFPIAAFFPQTNVDNP